MSTNRDRILALVENNLLTADELNMMLVKWCSEADLAEFISTYDLDLEEEEEEEEDYDEEYEREVRLSREDDESFGPNYMYDYDSECDFADPGGNSALRRAHAGNPRNLPCPTCKQPNRLTPADKARGYQCDSCADRVERGYDLDY